MSPRHLLRLVAALAALLPFLALPAAAWSADYPPPEQGTWTARDFRFGTGETLPELRLHYVTLGDKANPAVLVLHGTGGSGTGMLTAGFAGELFGPGQPLDARRYYIVLPDAVGAGQSSKPSDGLRGQFPHYDYEDMVRAQHLLLTEGLGIRHARLVLGNSMGGMQAWMWAAAYPGFMDGVVPMAAQPTAMAARNRIMRRLLVDAIRQDPDYKGGDYAEQPPSLKRMNTFFGFATSGGTLALQAAAPTTAQADALVDARLAAPGPKDANDYVYQWDSSRDFDAAPTLDQVRAPVLAINSADDERNPPETGILDAALRRLPDAELYLIPASAETRGHGTTMLARFWKDRLAAFLRRLPAEDK